MKNMFHVPLYMELHTIERAALSTGIHVGGERCCPWWLIMWPSSFSPPTSWREAADTLGGMFSDCLLLDFLYPKMFFLPLQTWSHSSAAACPQSSSCYSFFFFFDLDDLPLLLPLYPPQVLFVPWHKIPVFLSFSRAFSCGSQDLLGKTLHLPAGHIFQRLCVMRCVRPSAPFSPLKQLLRASSDRLLAVLRVTGCFCTRYFYAKYKYRARVTNKVEYFPSFSISHQFISRPLLQISVRLKAFRKAFSAIFQQ